MKKSKLTGKLQNVSFAILIIVITFVVIASCEYGNNFVKEILPLRDPINAEVPTITIQPQNAVYSAGDAAQALTVGASVSDNGILSYQWYSNKENNNTEGTPIYSAVGDAYFPPTKTAGIVYYYVIITNTITGNNYGGKKTAQTVSNTAGIGIGVIPAYITGLSATSKVYDGTTDVTITGTPVIEGLNIGDKVTIIEGTAAFADKNTGTNKTITFSDWSLDGADAGNYLLLEQPIATADITAKPVTITGLSASNKVYNGTTTATVTGTGVISGKVEGDVVTVVTGTAAFANATIGTSKAVIFSGWSLSGVDAGNYMLSAQPASVMANISLVEMVFISGGTFQMGDVKNEGSSDEKPVHTVTLSNFYMGKYEITQKQWQDVMGSLPERMTYKEIGIGNNYPVYSVSFKDALMFCNKLSVLEGLTPAYSISGSTDPSAWGSVPTDGYTSTGNEVTIMSGSTGYRLPTEAQWEYAAKGGNGSPGNYTYSGSNDADAVGWYDGNSGYTTHEVGNKQANGLGLYDMSGNVWEWCWDWYGSYSSEAQNDPCPSIPPETNNYNKRVYRGGRYSSYDYYLRSSFRNGRDSDWYNTMTGFRLIRP